MQVKGIARGKPEDVGFTSDMFEEHRERARLHLRRNVFPGRAECIVKDNKLVFLDVIGHADAESKVKMNPHTLFRGFSMTKPVTGIALLMLQDEGKLNVKDPVGKYIPSFNNLVVVKSAYVDDPKVTRADTSKVESLRRPVCLADLMMHTSGLSYGPMRSDVGLQPLIARSPTERLYKKLALRCDNSEITSLQQFCDELADIPLRCQPGTAYNYSYGMDVIGRVIEIVSGKKLDAFMRERIFKPLGLRDTTFVVPLNRAKRQLAAYYSLRRPKAGASKIRGARLLKRMDGKRTRDSAWVKGSKTQSGTLLVGGGFFGSGKGGLLFSLHDMTLLINMIVHEGKTWSGKQLLKKATARSLQTDWLARPYVAGRKIGRRLKGWDEPGKSQDIGWSPAGHVQLKNSTHIGANWMGGTGYWWADTQKKMFCICLHEAYWDQSPMGWVGDKDDIENVLKLTYEEYEERKVAEKKGVKRKR